MNVVEKVCELCNVTIPEIRSTVASLLTRIVALENAENPLIRLFEGEDSGTTDTGSYNMSLGNGNELTNDTIGGWGSTMPQAVKLEQVTIGARINPADGSQYQVWASPPGGANAVAVGPVLALPGGTLKEVYAVNANLPAKTTLQVKTIEGGATDVVAVVWGRLA